VASWATLAAPIGPALGFALARLDELPGGDLGNAALGTFALAAAARFTAYAEGFRDAERAFGEATWRRAVIGAAASPQVQRVAMRVSHFAPFAPYAIEEELLAVARKMTASESELAAFFFDRGPAMARRRGSRGPPSHHRPYRFHDCVNSRETDRDERARSVAGIIGAVGGDALAVVVATEVLAVVVLAGEMAGVEAIRRVG
jgi:hypothetical protein